MSLIVVGLVIVCVGIIMYLRKKKSSNKPFYSRIRVEKPKGTPLSLAEVQAFSPSGENVALLGKAVQSSTRFAKSRASNAINGITQGSGIGDGYVTQTNGKARNDNFWQLKLKEPSQLSHIKVFNRIDCCSERLEGAKLIVFDDKSNVLFEKILTSDITQSITVP